MSVRIGITGASGFLGTALVRRLSASGAEVHAFTRRPVPIPGVIWHAYELEKLSALPLVQHVDVIVHLAFKMEGAGPHLEEINVAAAQQLRDLAKQAGKRFLFVSSMSAHAEAASAYGRAKWRIECLLDPGRDTIVRPGLVIGPGGVYARMFATLRKAPIVPLFFGGNQPIQPISLENLAEGICRILLQQSAGVFNLGITKAITVRELYQRMLAAGKLRRPIVPFPGGLAVHALQAFELFGLRLPISVENILGQKHLKFFETSGSLEKLGLVLTPMDEMPWVPANSLP